MGTVYLFGYTEEYAPEFKSTSTAFHVIFKNLNYNADKASHYDSAQVAMNVVIENERSKRILDCLAEDNSISARALARKLQEIDGIIQRNQEEVRDAGIIRRVGGNRYGHWEIVRKWR